MKKFLSLVLTLAVALNFVIFVPHGSDSSAAKVYNLNNYTKFSSRTAEEVAEKYYAALNTKTTSYYSETPSTKAPYAVGALNNETSSSITSMLNFYRWLVGVDELPVSVNSSDLQAGALIRNFDFAHKVDISNKPDDMSDDLWNKGANCDHNILASGYAPQGAITGFLNEGYNITSSTFGTIGHRAFLLSYKTVAFDFGYAGNICIGDATQSSKSTLELPFTSFPCPGYVPSTMITLPKKTSWSVELNSNVLTYDSLDDITVTVKDLTEGTSYVCTKDNGKLILDYGMLSFVQPECKGSTYTNEYEVILTGVKDKNSGEAVTLQYSCEFINPIDYPETTVSKVEINITDELIFSNSMSANDIQKIVSSFDYELNVTCENTRKLQLPIPGPWEVGNDYVHTSLDPSFLPTNVHDSNNCLSSISIPYTKKDLGEASASKTNFTPGESGCINFTRTYMKTDIVQLYKVDSNGNLVLVANQNSPTFEETEAYYGKEQEYLGQPYKCRFALNNIQNSDSGTYYICYGMTGAKVLLFVGPIYVNVEVSPSATPGPIPTPKVIQTPEKINDVGDFVERCYKVAFNRKSDNAGYTYWCSALNNGEICGAQVGYGFIFSQEYFNQQRADDEYVKDLYKMFFDRIPDTDGFNGWMNKLKNGATREEIFAGFANSLEFSNLCASYGVIQGAYLVGVPLDQQSGVNCFVARLYKVCLNRLPDMGGQSSWVGQLMDGRVTGATCAYGFVFSPEFVGSDPTNEEFVAYMYRAMFGREPDTDGFNTWVQELINGKSRIDVFRGFVGSLEFNNLCSQYGIVRGNI
ncbi:MAG: DUF4214 domain-containing protein [Clostridia bacterium]|nr:DUF4214 domain-containing protein [Clostridia bacterium]